MAREGSIAWQLGLLFWTALGAAIGITGVILYALICPLCFYRDIRQCFSKGPTSRPE